MVSTTPDRAPWWGPWKWLVERGGAIKWTLVVVAVLVNALKGILLLGVSTSMWPYWALSYRHGFIRRGLAGTAFQFMASGLSVEDQRRVVLELHFTLLFALAAGLFKWSRHVGEGASPRVRLLLFTGTAAVFLSALFPTLGATSGYLDVYALALACTSAFLAFRRQPLAAGVLAMFGPLVHDAFLFLWLPVVACAVSDVLGSAERRRTALRWSPIILPLISEPLALALHSPAALAQNLAELPAEWRDIKAFELPLRDLLARMTGVFVERPEQLGLAALFYGWPAAVAATCAVALAPGRLRRRVLVTTLVTLAPCTILLVAWDLSRFLVWSSYGAFLVLCWSARAAREREGEAETTPTRRANGAANVALAMLVACAAGGPYLFSYFDYTFADYNFGPAWLRWTPGAKISQVWLGLYNRKFVVRSMSSTDGCPLGGRNIRIDDRCVVTLSPDALVESRLLVLARGAYTARIEVEPVDDCLDATGELGVHLRWRFASPKPIVPFDAESTRRVSLDFTIDAEEEVMGRIRVDVTTRGGCFRLRSMTVGPRQE